LNQLLIAECGLLIAIGQFLNKSAISNQHSAIVMAIDLQRLAREENRHEKSSGVWNRDRLLIRGVRAGARHAAVRRAGPNLDAHGLRRRRRSCSADHARQRDGHSRGAEHGDNAVTGS